MLLLSTTLSIIRTLPELRETSDFVNSKKSLVVSRLNDKEVGLKKQNIIYSHILLFSV